MEGENGHDDEEDRDGCKEMGKERRKTDRRRIDRRRREKRKKCRGKKEGRYR